MSWVVRPLLGLLGDILLLQAQLLCTVVAVDLVNAALTKRGAPPSIFGC